MSATMTASPEFRAAGTDLSERRRSGVSKGPLMDIVPASDITGMHWGADGTLRIGAYTRSLRSRPTSSIAAAYPGIVASAQGLATPQIRHLATLGGNLAQRSRCWYYRNPHIACLKKGGTECPARDGNHLYGVAFDLGPCVAPHPSTMAAALLAYDATIITYQRERAVDPGRAGRRLERCRRQRAAAGRDDPRHRTAHAAARRACVLQARDQPQPCGVAAGRSLRPRRGCQDGTFQFIRLAAGGIAPVPLRLKAAEAALQGKPANALNIEVAAKLAVSGAKPLPMTGYKLDLLEGVVRDLLEKLAT